MHRLTGRQRRFLREAVDGLDPWESSVPLKDAELQVVVDAVLVVQAFEIDDDGDYVWFWQTTPAGRAALDAREGETDE